VDSLLDIYFRINIYILKEEIVVAGITKRPSDLQRGQWYSTV
jgi:hypothetical protein